MKKLFLLLTFFGLLATACESGGGVEEENGGNTPTLKIELSKQTVDVDFETGTYSISVTSPYSWRASSDNDWIIVNSKTGIAGTKELKFSVKRNEEEEIREGTIVIKNEDYNLIAELYVVQKSFTPSIVIEPEALSFTVEGGEQNIAVTANFEYEISTSADWVSYKKIEKGLTITVHNYKEVEERSAVVTISSKKYKISKNIKVSQCAFEPKFDVTPTEINFAVEGGEQNIAITANFEYEISTSADWVSYKKTEKGLTITVPNYTEVKERTAEITISSEKYNLSKNIKVTQDGLTEEEYAKHLITYTSTDGAVIDAANSYRFGANIISNTYENGIGIIRFDAPVALIGEKAFWNCDNLESITIPNSATSIGKNAFINCSGLKNITIGDNVTSIGFGAFSGCISLTGITIGDNVTEIGERAFFNCSSLESVTMGNNVTEIGVSAFEDCTSLTSITIPDGVTTMRERVLKSCSSLTSVIIGKGVTTIGNAAFGACVSLTSLEIPDNVTLIEEHAFYSCIGLISITLPNSITEIKENTFNGCENLISVTIPDSVTIIRERAFDSCGLVSITIGNNVTTIENCAFIWCRSLKNVTISESVTLIGEFAFYACTSLAAVYCKPTTPPTGSSNMFTGNDPDRKIYVPTNSVNAYKREMYWMNYHQYIVGYDF